ncbi:Syntaxin-7 [Nymphon striatum]|nr:Syntaxin-7 [Nymphon striatum]
MAYSYHSTGGGSGYSLYQSGGDSSYSSAGQNEFGRLSQLIGTNIQKISQNVSSVERWVNQLGTHQDSEQLRSQLHQIQHYTNQLAKDTNKHMKDLAHLASVNPSEQKQQKMQKERLTNEFSEALKNFQDCQRKAAQKEKDSVKRARANSGLDGDPFLEDMRPARNDTQLINLASIRMFTLTFPASVKVKAFKIVGIPYSAVKLADLGYNLDYKLTISPPAKFSDLRGHSLLSRNIHRVKLHPLMASLAFTGQRPTEPSQSQMQLQLEEDVNIEALKEREKSIKQLESDIVDVNTIFKDLATMVHEQGDIIGKNRLIWITVVGLEIHAQILSATLSTPCLHHLCATRSTPCATRNSPRNLKAISNIYLHNRNENNEIKSRLMKGILKSFRCDETMMIYIKKSKVKLIPIFYDLFQDNHRFFIIIIIKYINHIIIRILIKKFLFVSPYNLLIYIIITLLQNPSPSSILSQLHQQDMTKPVRFVRTLFALPKSPFPVVNAYISFTKHVPS